MSSCEKCWADSRGMPEGYYSELVRSRKCTPEEQAGPDAQWCADCGRITLHQYTKQCMNAECDSVKSEPDEHAK